MNVDWTLAGSVMLSGVVIVFIGLIILILMVTLVGKILGAQQARKQNRAKQASQQASPTPQPAASAPAAPVVQSGIAGETVAAISAAVAVVMSETAPGTAYTVSSIQRSKGSRPVWGFAGMQQNTRPF